MEPIDYLRALRRRWTVIASSVVLAGLVAFATTAVVPVGPPVRSYEARAVLLRTRGFTEQAVNLKAIAALTTVGEVPVRVDRRLRDLQSPVQLARAVEVGANTETGQLHITARDPDPERAESLANTFAVELLGFLQDRNEEAADQAITAASETVDQLTREINSLERKVRSASGSRLAIYRAERDAKIRRLSFAYERLQQANVSTLPVLEIIERAQAVPSESSGITAPSSRTARVLLAAILGLLAGLALALVLERFDTRIRNKQGAEKHFGHPVLAEIPFVPRRNRRDLDVRKDRGRSYAADAFRLLGAAILRPPAGPEGNGHVLGEGRVADGPGRTILVTSPGPSEGKSTVVSNLASVFAELGKTVVILSCDFRRPTLHRLFGVPNDRGLARALATSSDTPLLRGHVRKTELAKVRLVPSGPPPDHPGELLASPGMARAVEEARQGADVVILDTAPILVASDATHLLPLVDAVVVVARARRTTAQVAERTSELLERFHARVIGVALNAAREAPMPRRYYYYYRTPRFRRLAGIRVFPTFRGTRKGSNL
ncbi:MAG TPA: polysaccharide biosynthesis tyrosine autokinase [Actinomycetota bacterium]